MTTPPQSPLGYMLNQTQSTADMYYGQLIMDALPDLPLNAKNVGIIGKHSPNPVDDKMHERDNARVEAHVQLIMEFNDRLQGLDLSSPPLYKAAVEFLAASRRLELKSGAMTEAKIRTKESGSKWVLDAAPGKDAPALLKQFFEAVDKRCDERIKTEPESYQDFANNPSYKGTQL